jgi:hypothetical protein
MSKEDEGPKLDPDDTVAAIGSRTAILDEHLALARSMNARIEQMARRIAEMTSATDALVAGRTTTS